MRSTFIRELYKYALQNKNIFLLSGDLGYGVIDEFKKKLPDQFMNAGISEQNMIGMASGLSSSGYKVFCYSIINFLTFRAAEQIRNDLDYHNYNVCLVGVGAGLSYGNLGYTHHGIQDYGLIRLLKNFVIYSPGDKHETRWALSQIMKSKNPTYLRLSKNVNHDSINFSENKKYINKNGFSNLIKENNKNLIIISGAFLQTFSDKAKLKYLKNYDLISLIKIYPIDKRFITGLNKYKKIIIFENSLNLGGLCSYIVEEMIRYKISRDISSIKSVSINFNHIDKNISERTLFEKYFLKKLKSL